MTLLLAALAPALVAFLMARSLLRLRVPRLQRTNVAGRFVPVVLGLALAAAWMAIQSGALFAAVVQAQWSQEAERLTLTLVAGAVVAGVGFVDDLQRGGPRGLRGHADALWRGQMSTGAIKVVGIVAAAGIVALAQGRSLLSVDGLLAVIVVAASANLINGLDVVPGRAAKWFLLASVVLLVAVPHTEAWVALVVLVGAELPLVSLDLRERGMLGDTGANLLGFMAGAALAGALGTLGLGVAAVTLVAANVLAETVGLSNVIARTAPLRWFDGLGRLPIPPDPSMN